MRPEPRRRPRLPCSTFRPANTACRATFGFARHDTPHGEPRSTHAESAHVGSCHNIIQAFSIPGARPCNVTRTFTVSCPGGGLSCDRQRWILSVGQPDHSSGRFSVTLTVTSMPRKDEGEPTKVPHSGRTSLASQATATRMRLRLPTMLLVGSKSIQPAPGK
jgi:hypothetical protein